MHNVLFTIYQYIRAILVAVWFKFMKGKVHERY